MKIIIQSYLSRYYEIKTSELGNDGVYLKEISKRKRAPINHEKLLIDLNTIFGIGDDDLILHVTDWGSRFKPDIDLEFYWKDIEDFPMSISFTGMVGTMPIQLVNVEPLAAPKGKLFYLDYRYDTPDRNGRIYEETTMHRAIEEFSEGLNRDEKIQIILNRQSKHKKK